MAESVAEETSWVHLHTASKNIISLLNHQVNFLILRYFENSGLTEVGAGSPDFPSSCIPLLKESDKLFLQPRWIAGTYPWVGLEKSQLQHFDFRSGRWQTHDQIDTPGSPHPPALWETPDITV